MQHTFRILSAFAATAALSLAASPRISVDCNRPEGRINYAVAGLSQGGGGDSIATEQTRTALAGMPVRLVRVEGVTGSMVYGDLVDPVSGEENFARLDAEIEAIRAAGGEPIVNFFYTPAYLSSGPADQAYRFPPRDPEAYARLCAAIVRHLNLDKGYGVKLFEFWNEPSGNFFWSTWSEDPASLFRQYEAVCRAVLEVDPTVKFGIMADNPDYPSNYDLFYDYLKEHAVPVDFVTFHWYGDWDREKKQDPRAYARFGEEMRQQFKRHFGRVPEAVYVTEWNLMGESVDEFSPGTVAGYIAASLIAMNDSPAIDGACFFRVLPYKDDLSSLIDGQGRQRLACRILNFFNRLPEIRLHSSVDDGEISALAAADAGRFAMLIARYAAADAGTERIAVSVAGVTPDCTYNLTVSREDDASGRALGASSPTVAISARSDAEGVLNFSCPMPARSVVFVEITGGGR